MQFAQRFVQGKQIDGVEIGAFDRASLVFDKDQLLVPEPLLARRLAFLRGEYERP